MTVLTVTDKAKDKVQELCAKNGKYAVRLGLKGGGCAGFSYDWGFAEQSEIDKEDELIKCNEGNLVIDTSSAFCLERNWITLKKCLVHILTSKIQTQKVLVDVVKA